MFRGGGSWYDALCERKDSFIVVTAYRDYDDDDEVDDEDFFRFYNDTPPQSDEYMPTSPPLGSVS